MVVINITPADITRYSLPLFAAFLALGLLGLALAHGRIEGPSFKGLYHIGAFLVLLSGVLLMWRAEHQR